ncbi:MAG: universal stress protein [Thiohalomonadaceae bacterium]
MSGYSRILIAVDLGEVSDEVCGRGADLARRYGAQANLVHVVEPVLVDPVYDMMPAVPFELELQHLESVRRQVGELGSRFAIHGNRCFVETGATRAEIIRVAEELAVQLIVVGSHSRRGAARLLGSTASSVLHAAPCDVLAVRISD